MVEEKNTIPPLAPLALALSLLDWRSLGLTTGNPETDPTDDLVLMVERATALMLVRCAALVAPNEYTDLSSTTICRTVLIQGQWPEALTDQVIRQLRQYVQAILSRYNNVYYHNSKHAMQVILSANKLMDLMLQEPNTRLFGLRNDPLQLFGVLFAALIHDVDHRGIPNRQLASEDSPLAVMYNDQSIAENRSLCVGFAELLKDDYHEFRRVLFHHDDNNNNNNGTAAAADVYHRFRKQVVDLVLTTDIACPGRSQITKSKFKEAFGSTVTSVETAVSSKTGGDNKEAIECDSVSFASSEGELFLGDVTKKEDEEPDKNKVDNNNGSPIEQSRKGSTKSRSLKDFLHRKTIRLKSSITKTNQPPSPNPKKLGIRRSIDLSGEPLEHYNSCPSVGDDTKDTPDELKATVVLETIITMADVAHNLQGWEQMVSWAGDLYMELRQAFLDGRGSDPKDSWFNNQIGFLEMYMLPLSKNLDNTGVFGDVKGRMFAETVLKNRDRWLVEGKQVTQDIIARGASVVKHAEEHAGTARDVELEMELELEPDTSPSKSANLKAWGVGTAFTMALVVLLLGVVLQMLHIRLSLPIRRGQVIPPGCWLSKCGLMGFLPSCENAYLNVDANGFVTLYNADFKVAWEIKGGVCHDTQTGCIDGMRMTEDRVIQIGGEVIKTVDVYVDSDLAPWPFAYEPKIKKHFVQ